LQAPVLFLIFNRPKFTKRVFEVIKQAKPKYLYIAADGPRDGNAADNALCQQSREVALQIDWDCEIKTLFRQGNLGCKQAVSGAINWFFDNEEEGIILEDDCLPDLSFFPYCEELLKKYRAEDRVMSVSGSNLLGTPWKYDKQSYCFGHGGIWGWATWKRAWKLYDATMSSWQYPETKSIIKKNIKTVEWYQFYYHMFESSFNSTLDTWDIQWFYTILINDGLTINPAVNLVSNIGFGEGTHLNSEDNFIAKLAAESISVPLSPPMEEQVDVEYLKLVYQAVNGDDKNESMLFSALKYIKQGVRKIRSTITQK
jgi:hypothetical protein